MEFANVSGGNRETNRVRVAVRSDARAIASLLQRVPYSHMHVDWRLPVDWLGTPGFVVLPEPEYRTERRRSVAEKFLPPMTRLYGCLAVAAEPPPAAWIRVASIAAVDGAQGMLGAMLAEVLDFLRESAVSELGWLAIKDWPNGWLPDLGFVRANEIETYVKEDMWLPGETAVSNLKIRPVQPSDMVILEQMEEAAFTPLWRHSAQTFMLASRQALSFDVAALDNRVVGFQLSGRTDMGAHLVRLTVNPDFQRQGVGSALLAHAIKTYHQQGLQFISLNTQVDNIPSQYLYRKFGFRPSGQRYPVWVLPL